MTQHQTLSLRSAILININIMMGTGIFINTVILAKQSGLLGAGIYTLAGLLMLPLVLSMAEQTKLHTEGNFYSFGRSISSFWGFMNTWIYFFTKLASATLSLHVFTLFLINLLPILKNIPLFYLEICLISFFIFLNTLHIKTGKSIQIGFVLMKSIPLLFALIAGLWSFNIINIAAPHIIWSGIATALPLTLFCYLGFETICSLSRHIENPQVNRPRAIIISFSLIILITTLYQLFFYASLGPWLGQQINYVDAFPGLINKTVPHLIHILTPLFSIAIGTSALGGAYGILYSNSWNLFTLAQKNHLIGSSFFAHLNRYNAPTLCVIAEGIICITYLFITKGSQLPLQYTAVMGCIIAYTISIFALYRETKSLLSMCGLITCVILGAVCLNGFIHTTLTPLIIFGVIIISGLSMFYAKNRCIS